MLQRLSVNDTVGYGHQAPETHHGRVVCVFYSLVGIPLNIILIGALASLFSNKVKFFNVPRDRRGARRSDLE